MTKTIGIVAQNSFGVLGVNISYLNWVKEFGTPVAIFPTDSYTEFQKLYPKLDAVVLPGGPDVDTSRYALWRGYWTGEPEEFLEGFDTTVLPKLIGTLPIFGICRGLQTVNVAMGGTLRQHLFKHPYSKFPKDIVHKVYHWKTRTLAGGVNSFHHQCIKKLAPDLEVEMYSEDNIWEAVSSKALKIFAVQYHPERLGDGYAFSHMKTLLGG